MAKPGAYQKVGKDLPDLGKQIRLWRLAQNMTQSNLEEKAGLSHNAVSRIECGMVSPRIDTIERIAQALDVSVERLQFQAPASESGGSLATPDPRLEDDPISELIAALNQLPQPKRKQLLRTFLDLIRIAAGETDA